MSSSCRVTRLGVSAGLVSMIVGVVGAPIARADSTDGLRSVVAAARGTAACGSLRSDPLLDQAATQINETTNRWVNKESRAVPETDALVLLKDLGYGGDKATTLSSAAKNDGDAIKALVLQGFAKIPDCSYAAFGVSALYNELKGMTFLTVVLAG